MGAMRGECLPALCVAHASQIMSRVFQEIQEDEQSNLSACLQSLLKSLDEERDFISKAIEEGFPSHDQWGFAFY